LFVQEEALAHTNGQISWARPTKTVTAIKRTVRQSFVRLSQYVNFPPLACSKLNAQI